MTYETAGTTLAALAAAWLAAHYLNAWAARRVDRAVKRALLADDAPVAPVEWDDRTFLTLICSDRSWMDTLADLDDDDLLAAWADGGAS